MAEIGYIKLHRKLLNWEWIENPNVLSIFVICLLKANHKANTWQGIKVPAGSLITSYEKLSAISGLSVRQVRTALDKLKMTGELTSKSTSRYSMISIKNWELYQINDKRVDKQPDRRVDSPAVSQMTTNKNDKEYKNIRNIEEEEEESAVEILKNWYGSEYRNVYLTDKEYQKLLGITLSEKALNLLIEDLSQKIAEGKEKNWSQETPNIHYARLRAYWDYRRKNPDKFREKPPEPHESIYSNELDE